MMEYAHRPFQHAGLCPVLSFGPVHISTYAILMIAAIAAGLLLYRWNVQRADLSAGETLPVILAALLGGVLGAKIPIWIIQFKALTQAPFSWAAILEGRTITGALVGGLLAVWLVKRQLGIRKHYGNVLAPSMALGMGIGRIGCLLAGCCCGKPSAYSRGGLCGIDLGDGLLRYPVQLYEIAFCLLAFILLQRCVRTAAPGVLLYRFITAYFLFRFFVEFLRPHPLLFGLTAFQWICLFGIALVPIRMWLLHTTGKEKTE